MLRPFEMIREKRRSQWRESFALGVTSATMVEIYGGEEAARERVERLFSNKRIDGLSVDIRDEGGQRWEANHSAGWFGIPTVAEPNSKYAVARATIATDDWIRLQAAFHGHNITMDEVEEYFDCIENDELPMGHPFFDGATLSTIEQMTESPTTAPEPVLELENKTEDISMREQEGRSRGLGAKKAGLDRIPIWVAARRDRH